MKIKIFLSLLGIGLLITLVSFFFLNNIIDRSLPNYNLTIKSNQIFKPTIISRDQYAIPTISAENIHDIYFSIGFLHAQDRLFQMDLFRKMSEGRLSEWFGDTTLVTDIFFRTLQFRSQSQQIIKRLTTEEYTILKAYTDGVNQYVETVNSNLPIEYSFLQVFNFEKWEEEQSIMIYLMFRWWLDYSQERSLLIDPVEQIMSNELLNGKIYLLTLLDQMETKMTIIPALRSVSGHVMVVSEFKAKPYFPTFIYPVNLTGSASDTTSGMTIAGLPILLGGKSEKNAWIITPNHTHKLIQESNNVKWIDKPEVIQIRDLENYNLIVKQSEDQNLSQGGILLGRNSDSPLSFTMSPIWNYDFEKFNSLIQHNNQFYPDNSFVLTNDSLFINGQLKSVLDKDIIASSHDDYHLTIKKELIDSSDYGWLSFVLRQKQFTVEELTSLVDLSDYKYAVQTKILLIKRLLGYRSSEVETATKYLTTWRTEFNKEDIGASIFVLWNYYFVEALHNKEHDELRMLVKEKQTMQQTTQFYLNQSNREVDSLIVSSVIKTMVTLKYWLGENPTNWRYENMVRFKPEMIKVGQDETVWKKQNDYIFSNGYTWISKINPDKKEIVANQIIKHFQLFGEMNQSPSTFFITSGGASGEQRSPFFRDQLALWKKNQFINISFKNDNQFYLTNIETDQ